MIISSDHSGTPRRPIVAFVGDSVAELAEA
jgi:hypothetical protein